MKLRLTHLICMVLLVIKINAQTVLDIVRNSPSHNTLEAAIDAANLGGALSSAGPITLFAPTDDAFNALPAGLIQTLLADPQGELTRILTYHVVGANALSSGLSNGQFVKTINDKSISIKIDNGNVFINNAQVTVADLVATNGVVHVINAVLLPPATVVDVLLNSPIHTTLVTAVSAASLVQPLQGAGPFTVFAPTDAAFSVIPPAVLQSLLDNPSGPLTDILLYHVTGSRIQSTTITDNQRIKMLYGTDAKIEITPAGVFINNSQITVTDLTSDNGIVHVINAVMRPSNKLFDIISKSDNHNVLEAAIRGAGLEDALDQLDGVTVFAPDDNAFAKLPSGTVEALLQDVPTLQSILLKHVVVEDLKSDDVGSNEFYLNFAGGLSTLDFDGTTLTADGVSANILDIEASNGIIHSIESVILAKDSTIMDVVDQSSLHNILQIAIDSTNISDEDAFISFREVLNSYGPFTFFAPVDNAFSVFNQAEIAAILNDPEILLTVLGEHLVAGDVKSTDLYDGQLIESANGSLLKVAIVDNNVFINGAKVIAADIATENGTVHVTESLVLFEPTTIMDIVSFSSDHETLEAALKAAELDGALDDEDAELTLFAPTDDAFAALPAGTVEALLQDPKGLLSQILLYHAVGSEAVSFDLSNGDFITTLNGKSVSVSIKNGDVFIDNAKVTVADIITDNGIIHVIDAVIIPPTTIADVLVKSPVHSTLVAAASAAGLVPTLSGNNKLTVFAPTDAAFAALPAGTVEALLQNPTGPLTSILLYHAVLGETLSTDLANGQTIPTVNGNSVNVTIQNGEVFINEAKVIVADVIADNGVVHVIDAVLLPPSKTNDELATKISIYPNPTSEYINIEDASNEEFDAQISDINGKLITSLKGIGSLKVKLDVMPGQYQVTVSKASGKISKTIIRI
jgi:uncharacterized surface protein with fasciclin (FAS1) repeats